MKKLLLTVCLFTFFNGAVWADAKDLLQSRLTKVDGFYAKFTQIVKTADNQLVQEGNGELWVNRPYYFNWQIEQPDEMSIISDGKTVWMYTPMVEQVTATWLKDVADNRLLLLITDSQNKVWDNYNVTRKDNQFTLTPTDHSGQNFIISALPTGMIADFTIIEEDGQFSFYELSKQKLGSVEQHRFRFTMPPKVTLDDQRQ